MKAFRRSALILLAIVSPACGQQLVEFSQLDGARPDTGKTDASSGDAAKTDIAQSDAATADVPNIEVVGVDVPSSDTGIPDATTPDGVHADAPIIGDLASEALNRDVGSTDAPGIDAGLRDTFNRDGVSVETSIAAPVDAPPVGDAHVVDAATSDVPIGTPLLDAGGLDASRLDAGSFDAAAIDAASFEAKRLDAGNVDGDSMDGSGVGPVIVINLGLAAPFAMAATAGVTNTITAPTTHINGNVVLAPNQTCNAVAVGNAGIFGLCGGASPTISGTVITDTYPDTTTASAVEADLNMAFLSISPLDGAPVGLLGGATPIDAPTTLGNVTGSALVIGDNRFTPGVYRSTTSILITGDIVLDGQGDPNAVFVFQSASTLGTADGDASPAAHTRILLTNGTKASNVWWQVSSSATIGTYTEFQGNILAKFSITMKTRATACGRSMAGAAGDGALVFDSNEVSVPGNGCPL
jgi:hypothetical protein